MWLKRWQTVNCVWCKQILPTKTESPNCKLNSKAQPWYVPLLIEWHCHFVFRHFKMIFIFTVLFMWNIWYLFFTGTIPQGFPSQRYTLSLNEYIQIAWGWLYHSNMGWKVKRTINRDTVNTKFAIEMHNVHWSHFGSHRKTSDLLDV